MLQLQNYTNLFLRPLFDYVVQARSTCLKHSIETLEKGRVHHRATKIIAGMENYTKSDWKVDCTPWLTMGIPWDDVTQLEASVRSGSLLPSELVAFSFQTIFQFFSCLLFLLDYLCVCFILHPRIMSSCFKGFHCAARRKCLFRQQWLT